MNLLKRLLAARTPHEGTEMTTVAPDRTSAPIIINNPPIDDHQEDKITVKRKLTPLQLFMITVNGTLGAGLYIRSGQILQLAGPLAAFLSFLILGFLAWAVMQCIAEPLCLWPVPGALPLFVSQFVDKELGYAVAFAYWLTYAMGFSALVTLSASTVSYWVTDDKNIAPAHIAIYAVLPVALGIINTLEIGWYGLFEVVTGIIKLTMLAILVLALVFINATSEKASASRTDWEHPFVYDEDAAADFVPAFIMTLPIAIFAYSGVEIIAASVIEARWPSQSNSSEDSEATVGSQNENGQSRQDTLQSGSSKNVITTIKATAVGVPIVIAIAYTIGGLLVSLALNRNADGLEELKWIERSPTEPKRATGSSHSPFILIAKYLDDEDLNHPLKHIFNAFILFTTVTCANTNLYVSSRTLFGIARNIRAPEGPHRYLAFFGKTDNDRVPQRAVWISVLAFYWVPFLQIPANFELDNTFGWVGEVLVRSGSISVVIVWACQCLAYIRYYRCINRYKSALQNARLHPQGASHQKKHMYPCRNHWQPLLAWIALVACLLVLLFCNSAFLWKKFYLVPFLSGYLPILVFLLVWLGQKLFKGTLRLKFPWFYRLTETEALDVIRSLNEKRSESFLQPESVRSS